MPKIYRIGSLRIRDNGNGRFDRDFDRVQIEDEAGYSKIDIDSSKAKALLKDMGIGDLSGVKLGALKKYMAALERFKQYPKLVNVLTKEASVNILLTRVQDLEKAAKVARIDVSDDSVFQNMVLGSITAIDSEYFVFSREQLMSGCQEVNDRSVCDPLSMKIIDALDGTGKIKEEQHEEEDKGKFARGLFFFSLKNFSF